mgnify:CR=1 FL=1
MKKKRKDERDFQVKDTLRDGINELLEGNDTTITNIFNNQRSLKTRSITIKPLLYNKIECILQIQTIQYIPN